ncbi:unnamed protein product, partial [Rotaria sp. Silwood2]
AFGAALTFDVVAPSHDIAVSNLDDINGNDIVVACNDANVRVLLHNVAPNAFFGAASYAVGAGGVAMSVALANLDGIKNDDIIVASTGADEIRIFLNDGNGVFPVAASQIIPTAAGRLTPQSVAAGDVSGDGFPDVVVGYTGSSNIGVLLNDGKGVVAAPFFLTPGVAPRAVRLADINNDGKLDILYTSNAGNSFGYFRNTGNNVFVHQGPFAIPQLVAVNPAPIGITAADINADGTADVIIAENAINRVDVFTTSCP